MKTIVETERLALCELDKGDAEFILELVNDPAWYANVGDFDVRTIEDAEVYIEDRLRAMYARDGHGLYRVYLKDSGDSVGICGLINRVGLDGIDLGFAISRRFRRNGYAKESAKAMIDHAAEAHGLRRLVAITKSTNDVSGALLKKLGFRFSQLIRLSEDAAEEKLYVFDMS